MIADATKDTIKRAPACCDPRRVASGLNLDTRGVNGREQRQAGGGIFVCCPWHSERRPSCSLSCGPDGTLRAHCFACGKGGDVFAVVAAVRGLDVSRDFPAVLREAGALAGVDVAREEHHERRHERPRVAPAPTFAPVEPAPMGPGDRAFGALVAPLLHLGALDGSPVSAGVCAYLAGRGMLDVARAEGWAALPAPGSAAARSWCQMLADVAPDIAHDLEIDASIVAAELSAIVREDRRAFRHEEHRLVVPYFSPCGVCYTWQRRALYDARDKYVFPVSRDAAEHEEPAREGRGRSARWPYGVERLAAASVDAPIVFTEGALDAGAVRAIDAAAGRVRVVLGVPGTQAWRRGEGFFATLARGRVAFVATDADAPKDEREPPGESAAKRWGADLWRAGALDVQRERPIGAKDWSEALALALRGNRT